MDPKELVQELCSALGQESQAEGCIPYLQEQWLRDINKLRELSGEQWQQLSLPLRLKWELQHRLKTDAPQDAAGFTRLMHDIGSHVCNHPSMLEEERARQRARGQHNGPGQQAVLEILMHHHFERPVHKAAEKIIGPGSGTGGTGSGTWHHTDFQTHMKRAIETVAQSQPELFAGIDACAVEGDEIFGRQQLREQFMLTLMADHFMQADAVAEEEGFFEEDAEEEARTHDDELSTTTEDADIDIDHPDGSDCSRAP